MHLNVTHGNAAGSEILVEGELVIGRQSEGPGSLGGDVELSRQHARIYADPAGFVIEDLGSTNGTFVNGHQLSAPALLTNGDVIEVGGARIEVEGAEAEADLTPEPGPAPEPEPAFEADPEPAPAAEVPPIDLRVEVDAAAGQAHVRVGDEGEAVTLLLEDGRWRIAHPV